MPGTDTDISIDSFRPGDEGEIVDLILSIQREEFGMAISLQDQPDLSSIAEFYQTGAGGFWVARASGRIAPSP